MKWIFTLLALCSTFIYVHAQNKIVITYDENGNRIKREMVCIGCRPADTSSEDPGTLADNTTATAEPELKSKTSGVFSVFPNPADNSVNVKLDELSLKERCLIVLSDVSGKEHYRKSIEAAITTIPLHRLADGIYFLTLFRGQQKDLVKIVKETGAGNP